MREATLWHGVKAGIRSEIESLTSLQTASAQACLEHPVGITLQGMPLGLRCSKLFSCSIRDTTRSPTRYMRSPYDRSSAPQALDSWHGSGPGRTRPWKLCCHERVLSIRRPGNGSNSLELSAFSALTEAHMPHPPGCAPASSPGGSSAADLKRSLRKVAWAWN